MLRLIAEFAFPAMRRSIPVVLAVLCTGSSGWSAGKDAAAEAIVRISAVDIKHPDPRMLEVVAKLESESPSAERDEQLERARQRLYELPLREATDPEWVGMNEALTTPWREAWTARCELAAQEAEAKGLDENSLAKALRQVRPHWNEDDAVRLHRVMYANFGAEKVWIVLVNWERTALVDQRLAASGEYSLGHILAMAFRVSDQELVSITFCI